MPGFMARLSGPRAEQSARGLFLLPLRKMTAGYGLAENMQNRTLPVTSNAKSAVLDLLLNLCFSKQNGCDMINYTKRAADARFSIG